MNRKTGNMSVKEGEDSLFRNLAPDTPEVKKNKKSAGQGI